MFFYDSMDALYILIKENAINWGHMISFNNKVMIHE